MCPTVSNLLKLQSKGSPILAHILTNFEEPKDNQSSRKRAAIPVKQEPEEPEIKKKHLEDDDADLIAAEILFRKISSNIKPETSYFDNYSCENGIFFNNQLYFCKNGMFQV